MQTLDWGFPFRYRWHALLITTIQFHYLLRMPSGIHGGAVRHTIACRQYLQFTKGMPLTLYEAICYDMSPVQDLLHRQTYMLMYHTGDTDDVGCSRRHQS